MSRIHLRFASLLLLLATVLISLTPHISGVTAGCPDVLGYTKAWKVAAAITVTASNFPASLQPCVQKAFDNWNTANGANAPSGNGSQVRLNVSFGAPVTVTGKTNVMQVTYSANKPDGTPLSDPGVTTITSNGTNLQNANASINTTQTTCDQVTSTTAHEIGHTMGLGDCTQCSDPSQSVMFGRIPPFTVPPYRTGPSTCDNSTVDSVYPPPPPPTIPGCQPDCPSGSRTCIPCGASPVILDVSGNGFHLTNSANGVRFDISGTGNAIQIAWTAPGSDNAFLALPQIDGFVHSGRELFGDFTPQPPSSQPNGFAALAIYDDPNNGGNGDGIIDARDAIFPSLRLWIDANHDGVSQLNELHTLPSLNVNSIGLDYKQSNKTDQYGNVFRFRAKVNSDDPDAAVSRKAYDVFFVIFSPIARNNNCIFQRPISAAAGGL
jgi:hypothetical protein